MTVTGYYTCIWKILCYRSNCTYYSICYLLMYHLFTACLVFASQAVCCAEKVKGIIVSALEELPEQ